MQSNSKVALVGAGALIIGVLLGYIFFYVVHEDADHTYGKMHSDDTREKMDDMYETEYGSMMGANTHTDSDGHGTQDGAMGAMMNALEGKAGDEFDMAFLSEMIVHHEGAVVMAQQALRVAQHQEIKDLAIAIITAQNKEIADMKTWQDAWYGQSTLELEQELERESEAVGQ